MRCDPIYSLMVGFGNLLIGILCLAAGLYGLRKSFLIIKYPTDMMMAEIDSRYVRHDLPADEKQHYEFCRDRILTEYRARLSASRATWLSGVVGMFVVGTYCIITGTMLSRRKSK